MPNGHKLDLRKLERRIDALSNALARLGKGGDLKELTRIIKSPGWTTPAEFAFALGIVESMSGHAALLTQLKTVLMKGSKAVATR
jgi:hypothetical protein